MKTNRKTCALGAVMLAIAALAPAVQAQQAMDHSAHQNMAAPAPAPAPAAAPMAGMDHSSHQGMTAPAPAAAAAQPAMEAMDHGDMRMQGGPPPPDARDPHAYAAGNTLTSGPYAFGPKRGLVLGDEHNWSMFLVDRLEAQRVDGRTTGAYDLTARFGRDYDKLVVKAEGEIVRSRLEESRTEALWSHSVATYWDAQMGLRYDTGPGPSRTWAAFGVQGLAPYWFEVDAAFYVGERGRTALRLAAEYELLLTQRWVLQPRIELTAYGKSDPQNGIGKGLSSVSAGLRLRYEISRKFAPYVGVEWAGTFGETAALRRAEGDKRNVTRLVAGLRMWF